MPKVGEPWIVPKGSEIKTTDPKYDGTRISKRTQTVVPKAIDDYGDDHVFVVWAGTGGYWQSVNVPKCPGAFDPCGNTADPEEHECPYSEIAERADCHCCSSCTQQCAWEV